MMALSMPTKPLTEVEIVLNERQNNLLSKYKLESLIKLQEQFKELLEVNISNEVRDELLNKADLEVKALYAFAKDGGFARDFVYVNNSLYLAFISIKEALLDPSLRNIDWAKMTAEFLTRNYREFLELIATHEKDLYHMAQHIRNVFGSLKSALKSIIKLTFNSVKAVFTKTLDFIETHPIPASLIALSMATGSLLAMGLTIDFAIILPACISPVFAASCLTGIALTSLYSAINKFKKENKTFKSENNAVESVGLRRCRDTVLELMRIIEEKKYYEEDHNRDTKPYRIVERKISKVKNDFENLIRPRV